MAKGRGWGVWERGARDLVPRERLGRAMGMGAQWLCIALDTSNAAWYALGCLSMRHVVRYMTSDRGMWSRGESGGTRMLELCAGAFNERM